MFDKVPAVKALNYVLFQSEDLVKIQGLVNFLDKLAIALPIVALLLFAVSIVLSHNRRRGLVRAATGLALSMAIVLVATALVRNQYLSGVRPPSSPEAQAVVLDTVTATLRNTLRLILLLAAITAIVGVLAGNRWVRTKLSSRQMPSWMTGGPTHDFVGTPSQGLAVGCSHHRIASPRDLEQPHHFGGGSSGGHNIGGGGAGGAVGRTELSTDGIQPQTERLEPGWVSSGRCYFSVVDLRPDLLLIVSLPLRTQQGDHPARPRPVRPSRNRPHLGTNRHSGPELYWPVEWSRRHPPMCWRDAGTDRKRYARSEIGAKPQCERVGHRPWKLMPSSTTPVAVAGTQLMSHLDRSPGTRPTGAEASASFTEGDHHYYGSGVGSERVAIGLAREVNPESDLGATDLHLCETLKNESVGRRQWGLGHRTGPESVAPHHIYLRRQQEQLGSQVDPRKQGDDDAEESISIAAVLELVYVPTSNELQDLPEQGRHRQRRRRCRAT